ncbi:MAG: Uma2 family endonuclease [Eubacterium sp.]|nr:Uma2 family endonuclease [Candidatus Colimonas fimequi]
MDLDKMRMIKEQRGYSIRQIAEYSGVPEGTVRKIFSGETSHPRVATMAAIDRVFEEDESLYQGKNYVYDMNAIAPEHLQYLDEAASAPVRVEETVFAYGKKDLFTIDDYYKLPHDCRCELIDGVFYDMGAPSVIHQDIVVEMVTQINVFLKATKRKCRVYASPIDVRILKDDHNMLQPDVIVVCNDKNKKIRNIEGAPEFCLEVVSKWSSSRDYIRKCNKYLQGGVKEYWIIDPFKKILMVYDFTKETSPEIIPLEGEYDMLIFGGDLTIDLDAVAELIREEEDEE